MSDACVHDAGFFPDGRTDERTDGQADSRSWIVKIYNGPKRLESKALGRKAETIAEE